jgi:hypothetical protein
MASVSLVRVAPVAVAEAAVAAIAGRNASGAALFTLPFGIRAVAALSTDQPGGFFEFPALRLNRTDFGTLASARQLTLEAPGKGIFPDASLPGAALQGRNAVPHGGGPRFSVLDNSGTSNGGSTGDMFNLTFGPTGVRRSVPVSRVDLSGYGETCFSLWADKVSPPPKISEVRFDVLTGRTAYEVVQEMSVLWPWQAIVVRTITIERKAAGNVVRFDSGWVAATPGIFRLAGFPDVFHPGAFKGFYNIRNIRELPSLVTLPGPPVAQYRPVRFDADAAIEHVTSGHREKGMDANAEEVFFVPVQHMAGYVQRLPLGTLSTADLTALFGNQGPIGGPADCEINVAGSGFHMRVSGIFADVAGGGNFAVALRGMPKLPSRPQWSVTRTGNAFNGAEENEPQPVDRNLGAPLIRAGLATLARQSNGAPYRFADPGDLFKASPDHDYGFLAATESFRVLFPRPEIEVDASHAGKKQISSSVPPLVADPYTVVSAAGPFPRGKHCIRFPNAVKPVLHVLPGNHLRFSPDAFKVAPFRVREQVKTSNWRMALEYADPDGNLAAVDVTIDSTAPAPATLDLGPISIAVDYRSFAGIMRMTGNLEARSPAVVTGASVVLGSILSPVGVIITILNDLRLPLSLIGSVVGGATWKQSIHIDLVKALRTLLKIPKPDEAKDDDRIDIGCGKFRGELNTGMFITPAGNRHAGFYFELIGEYQAAIIAKVLYGGGYFRLQFEFEFEEKTEGGQKQIETETKLELAVALAGSIGGEIIPKVLKGEANVRYGYLIELDLDKGEFIPGALVGMEVEAEALSGALALAFEWEGKAGMTRHDEKIKIKTKVSAAVTVTVAWYFEETVEVEGDFETEVDEKIVAGLLIAMGIVVV